MGEKFQATIELVRDSWHVGRSGARCFRRPTRASPRGRADDYRGVLFFGTPPARIDLLRSIPGATFEDAWQRRARVQWGSRMVNLIGLDDLIAAKRAAGRPQDLRDLKLLLAVKQRE